MNKRLLETKLNSIKHYDEEIQRLKDAAKVNQSVLDELISSLVEFMPFEKGNIITKNNRILRFDSVSEAARSYSGGIYFKCLISWPQNTGYFGKSESWTFTLEEVNDWKVINTEQDGTI